MAIIVKGTVKIARPIVPTDIAGLQLWLDASDSTTLFTNSAGTTLATADGDPIGCWKDKSGNGNNFTQSDGSLKPLIKNSVKNGKNGVRFDGINDRLVGGDILDLGTSNLYAFIVTKINNDGSTYGCIISKAREITAVQRWIIARITGVYKDIFAMGHPTNSPSQISVNKGDSVVTDYRCISYFVEKSGNPWVTLKFNGSLYNTVNWAGGDNSDWNTTNICMIGNTADAGGNASNSAPLNGDICEIILCIRPNIFANEIKLIENYLLNKWGLP